jgi:hypothetical protein
VAETDSSNRLQAWLMFHFITFHLRRMRENKSSSSATGAAKVRKSQQEKAKARCDDLISLYICILKYNKQHEHKNKK